MKAYLRICVSKVPNKHSSLTGWKQILAIFRKLKSSNFTLVTFQARHISNSSHVPDLNGFIRFITCCNKYSIADGFSIRVGVHRLDTFDHTRVSLDIANELHRVNIPNFQVFQGGWIKHISYGRDIVDLLVMSLINDQVHIPIMHHLCRLLDEATSWLHIWSHVLLTVKDVRYFSVSFIWVIMTPIWIHRFVYLSLTESDSSTRRLL